MRRGRPRHNDLLTPREWDVAELLVKGLTNEQISIRPGIGANTVKYHVAAILSKLEVRSREEAAARLAGEGHKRKLSVLALVHQPSRWAVERMPKPGLLPPIAGAGLLLIFLGIVVVWKPWSGSRPSDQTSANLEADLPSLGIDAPPIDPDVVHMTVCIDNDTWQRPTLEEQKSHVEADPRYAPWNSMYLGTFESPFHVGAGPATGRPNPFGKLYLFAGLWTAGDKSQIYAQLEAGCPDEPNVAHTDVVDVWLLGYEARTAVLDHGRVTIVVTPKTTGFQTLQVRFPGPAASYAGAIDIQDEFGNIIGHAE